MKEYKPNKNTFKTTLIQIKIVMNRNCMECVHKCSTAAIQFDLQRNRNFEYLE